MKAGDCRSLDELMKHWKNKETFKTEYKFYKETVKMVIDHKNDFFISDGIVDEEKWNKLPAGKRILYILKEAYDDNHDNKEWALNEKLRIDEPWDAIWHRVSEWTRGIINTSKTEVAKYVSFKEMGKSVSKEWLQWIAVMNIKKSGGLSTSNYGEISAYADADKEEIIREIELIDPDIIVCGYTFDNINRITGNYIDKTNDNWYYFSDIVGGKSRLFIDYFHPANRYPALMNYYGIVGIYQQALIEQNADD